jgi:Domain of unknown function (DUF4267)
VFDMTATTIADTLAGLIAAGIIFIGARFILAPRVAAAGYGVQPELGQRSAGAYLTVRGVRDIASGLFVFILMAAGAARKRPSKVMDGRQIMSAWIGSLVARFVRSLVELGI